MPSTSHHFAVVAAAASAAAGAIHAAASGSHADLGTLSVLFALTAVAQIGWAMAVLVRPAPALLTAGVGIQLAAFGAWLGSRTVGIGAIEGLEGGQSIGLPDALAVVPAMATPHDHGSHDHGEVAAAATPTASGDADEHVHDDSHDHGDGHHGDHESHEDHEGHEEAPVEPTLTEAELGYPPSFVEWLDQAPTPEARDRAEKLILETREAMKAFPDEAAVQAAGFISIGDGATGYEHYINVGRIVDPRSVDPDDIESIVMQVGPDGTKEVVSAMYLLPFGTTMDDVPDIAGDLTQWHDHQNLCWEGARVVGTTDATGSCQRGEFRPTQPMLHVWMTDHPCGPFAGLEGSHGEGCDHHDH